MSLVYNVPIKFYQHTLETFQKKITQLKTKNILLIASKRQLKTLPIDMESFTLITDSINNPDIELVHETLDKLTNKPELIISIGGGSTIDLGKAISALYPYKNSTIEELREIIQSKEYLDNNAPISLWAVPTTAGTGSECTKWATVWDFVDSKKYSIEADYLYPESSFLIPELTLTLPPKLTLSTGLDALSHAMEAYWSKSTNQYIRVLSRNAIALIHTYLPLVMENPDNLEYRSKMLMGSFFAGVSFSNTRTTACHSISYPLTMKYNIEHGFAVTLTLYEVLKRNWPHIEEKNLFLQAWNITNIEQIEEWLMKITNKLKLSDYGITEKDLSEIVKLSTTGGRMDNNPIIFTEKEILDILTRIL